jgi:hypothetical protein
MKSPSQQRPRGGLVLTRSCGESFRAGDVYVTLVKVGRGRARLWIAAPPDTVILRRELDSDGGQWPVPERPSA